MLTPPTSLPLQRFQWLQLQNIYYRDRKFSMEVYQNTRPGKKTGAGPVQIHAWYAINSKVVMAIWKMARDQHMFYRSKRTNGVSHAHLHTLTHSSHLTLFTHYTHIPPTHTPSQSTMTNLTEIIRQLNKLHRSNISPSSSHSSLSVESAKSNQAQGTSTPLCYHGY